jgi:hypothetical protein
MRRLILVLVMMGLLAPHAAQGGGVYGPGALFLHPTAFLPDDRRPSFGATYFTQTARIGSDTETIEWETYFVDQRLSKRVEGALVYLHQYGFSRTWDSYGGMVKYQLGAEQKNRPGLAIAVDYLGHRLRSASAYLVASKQFRVGDRVLRGHVGYVVTRRSDLPAPLVSPRFSETDDAPYAGVELFLTPDLRLVGEVEAKMKLYACAPVAVALMWNPSQKVGLGIGWVNTGRSEDARFFVGVGYKIGGFR